MYTPFFTCQVGFVTVTSLVKKKLLTIAGQTYFQKLYPNAIAPTWLKYKLKKGIYWRNSKRMKNDRTALGLWGRSQLHDTTV